MMPSNGPCTFSQEYGLATGYRDKGTGLGPYPHISQSLQDDIQFPTQNFSAVPHPPRPIAVRLYRNTSAPCTTGGRSSRPGYSHHSGPSLGLWTEEHLHRDINVKAPIDPSSPCSPGKLNLCSPQQGPRTFKVLSQFQKPFRTLHQEFSRC